ncbi:MAG: VOC family protein [Pseudomonadota bacterium]
MRYQIDHFVWGASDLAQGCEQMADLLGCAPLPGGQHPGMGTQNALVSLGDGVYLEIIAPSDDPGPEGSLGHRIGALSTPGLITWVLRTDALAEVAKLSATCDQDLTALGPMATQRKTPEGDLLSWELLFLAGHAFGGLLPFFIDWQETIHPSRTAPLAAQLASFAMAGPNATPLNQAFETLEIEQRAKSADTASLKLELRTGDRTVTLTSTDQSLKSWIT